MVQANSEFGVIRPSLGNPPLGEDEYRRIQASLERARNFSEREERIITTPVSHKEPVLALLHRLSDPWPAGYRTLAKILAPIP